MDEVIYEALSNYYHALELKGYMSQKHSVKLLILCFFREYVYHDYRGTLSREDYLCIEKALDCLYGTSCLLPYPNYMKGKLFCDCDSETASVFTSYMGAGSLQLGGMTELAQRIKNLENTDVLKLIHDLESVDNNTQSDVLVISEDD